MDDAAWWPLKWENSPRYREPDTRGAFTTTHPLIRRIIRTAEHVYFDELVDAPSPNPRGRRGDRNVISAYYSVLVINETDDLSIRAALLTLADPMLYPRSKPHAPTRKAVIDPTHRGTAYR